MLLHNICFRVFRSLEFAFLCLKMLENASLRGGGGVGTLQLPLPSYGPVVKVQNKFHKANQINLAGNTLFI